MSSEDQRYLVAVRAGSALARTLLKHRPSPDVSTERLIFELVPCETQAPDPGPYWRNPFVADP